MNAVIVLFAAALFPNGRPEEPALCDRGAPEPTAFHARGYGMVAEVFPPDSRNNDTRTPVVHMYRVGYPGPRWNSEAERVWTAPLPHAEFPLAAVVSGEGHVVTFDDHSVGVLDAAHAVVLLGADGRRTGDYAMSELFTPSELAGMTVLDCGYDWRSEARFFFLLDGRPRFYVVLADERALEFDLESGTLGRGVVADYEQLARVAIREYANEEVLIWPITLRFASITDRLR